MHHCLHTTLSQFFLHPITISAPDHIQMPYMTTVLTNSRQSYSINLGQFFTVWTQRLTGDLIVFIKRA